MTDAKLLILLHLDAEYWLNFNLCVSYQIKKVRKGKRNRKEKEDMFFPNRQQKIEVKSLREVLLKRLDFHCDVCLYPGFGFVQLALWTGGSPFNVDGKDDLNSQALLSGGGTQTP